MKNQGPSKAKEITLAVLAGAYRAARPLLGPASCRFRPTCSEYGFEALRRYGMIKGLKLAAVRIARCRPFSAGGYDPVP